MMWIDNNNMKYFSYDKINVPTEYLTEYLCYENFLEREHIDDFIIPNHFNYDDIKEKNFTIINQFSEDITFPRKIIMHEKIAEFIKFIEAKQKSSDAQDIKTLKPTYIPGQVYSIQGKNCDGFSVAKRFYKIIHVFKTLFDIPINSLVVRQIGGPQSTIWTLSRNDCDKLNIQYYPHLQLFPISMNWFYEPEYDDKEMIKNNKEKNHKQEIIPKCYDKILIKLNGFKYKDYYNTTIYNTLHNDNQEPIVFDEQEFRKRLQISLNDKLLKFTIVDKYNLTNYENIIPNGYLIYKYDDNIIDLITKNIYIVIELPKMYDEMEVLNFDIKNLSITI